VGTILLSAATSPSVLVERAQQGDTHARDILVDRFMPLARRVAQRFAGHQHPADDLTQVASIGLLKAIERFDGELDAAFSTYAHALMTGEVRRHIRDSRMVRIPRSIYEQVPTFQRVTVRLREQLGREPVRDEIAEALGVSKEDVIEIEDAARHASHVSLDAAAEEAGGELSLGDDDSAFARAEAGATLAPMLDVLTPRERMIIDLRFNDGLSQSEIAQGLGLSQTQVSRLIRRALDKLSARAGVAAR
jgi:RNA polymerase sigma-B factor